MKTINRYQATSVFTSSLVSLKMKIINHLRKSNANSKIYYIDEDNEDKIIYREIDIVFLSSFLSSSVFIVFTKSSNTQYKNESINRMNMNIGE